MGNQAQSPRIGHDGISVMVNKERAMRAREWGEPSETDHQAAEAKLSDLLARATGQRPKK